MRYVWAIIFMLDTYTQQQIEIYLVFIILMVDACQIIFYPVKK